MSNYSTQTVQNKERRISLKAKKAMKASANRWNVAVRRTTEQDEAAALTEEERQKMKEAVAQIASKLGIEEPLQTLQGIFTSRAARIRAFARTSLSAPYQEVEK